MRNLPPPPIPPRLREILKDYPELIQEVQEVLNETVANPNRTVGPYEWAVWQLQDTMSGFISRARRELATANDSGDPQAIERAEIKKGLMFAAKGDGIFNLHELRDYFRQYIGL